MSIAYNVKVGFWVRAYDETQFESEATDEAAIIEEAKGEAKKLMARRAWPAEIDDKRRQGTILWIDRVDEPDERDIAEYVDFDDDCIDTPATALLREAIKAWPQCDGDQHVGGADLLEWFGEWRKRAKEVAR